MDINAVFQRATSDALFEAQLRGDAARATQDGVGSAAWTALMETFAQSPDELRGLEAIGQNVGVEEAGTKTTLTTTTVTSLACTSTTTTTTTTWNQPMAPQGPAAPQ